jgi:hypothetical protein
VAVKQIRGNDYCDFALYLIIVKTLFVAIPALIQWAEYRPVNHIRADFEGCRIDTDGQVIVSFSIRRSLDTGFRIFY